MFRHLFIGCALTVMLLTGAAAVVADSKMPGKGVTVKPHVLPGILAFFKRPW